MKEYNEALRLRINELLDQTNDNANSISSNQAQQRRISRQLNEGKDFTVPTIIDILVKYPDVSADWLLTGEGSKYKPVTELPPVDVSSEESINHSAEVARLVREKNELIEDNEELREENIRLKAQLEVLKDVLRSSLGGDIAQKVG